MSVATDTSNVDFNPTKRTIRIEARNFGPIANGVVDLRPLTVFVGPSNTGKTYMSILVYALHKSVGGFLPLPAAHPSVNFPYDLIGYERSQFGRSDEPEVLRRTVYDLINVLDQPPVRYSDLPTRVRDSLQAVLQEPSHLGKDVETELMRCLDSGATSDLIRTSAEHRDTRITLRVGERGKDLWHFSLNMTDGHSTVSGNINDAELITKATTSESLSRSQILRRLRETPGPVYGTDLLDMVTGTDVDRRRMHYLPAARSGIMQSHRVIASSLLDRSTRVGLERLPELPTFSGVVADFMQRIILYTSESPKAGDDVLEELADMLQVETLAGQIGTRTLPGGYTDFAYRPLGTKNDIRLTRVSSMVSELAPVVLFLRGIVRVGDTLVIEEPEAHLHPAAQTRMAVTLARLIRAGVRVLITTHSDWLLKEIGNLMRAGVLAQQTCGSIGESSQSDTLHPKEVGIWLFRRDGANEGSTVQEIRYDPSEGVEPDEYDEIAEELYNRSADLQNKLEESLLG